ncbi:ABC-type Fe3+-hydroxamate transport system, periplasmic component [Xenococcus sp. PCC 7305]|uniref:ABC transporter substrate-binding protein n=1 Tax=Xenococcus sp. PCC 7305 TaxID=102125 RepID=UPI0002AC891D|nr:iron-siderophore ABC transporter substrate-binding protein [Xenococcus sp. PCC 7305]ELS00512.1 ABC-type Fe3+-hydroxamate transport system, periplasmic component [Xenococcus sp. PCC 7305]
MSQLCRYLSWFFWGICVVIVIAACDRQPHASLGDRPIAKPESCRLVEHGMGTTQICGQPQRVAALSPHILDSILALGAQPVAYAESQDLKIQTYNNPVEQIPYIGKWVTTQPIGLGDRKSPSLERLALIKPELILGEEPMHRDTYSLLSQIAPTLLFSDETDDGQQVWQQDIQGIAQALDRESQARSLLARFDQEVEQARRLLEPIWQTYPRVFLLNSNLTNYMASAPKSTTARLLKEIGFEIVQPPGVQGYAEISWEILPQIETDIILVLSWSDENFFNPENIMEEKWAKNPLLNSMSVFQQGRVYFVDYQLWGSVTRGPLTDWLILEALPDLLLSSVEDN